MKTILTLITILFTFNSYSQIDADLKIGSYLNKDKTIITNYLGLDGTLKTTSENHIVTSVMFDAVNHYTTKKAVYEFFNEFKKDYNIQSARFKDITSKKKLDEQLATFAVVDDVTYKFTINYFPSVTNIKYMTISLKVKK